MILALLGALGVNIIGPFLTIRSGTEQTTRRTRWILNCFGNALIYARTIIFLLTSILIKMVIARLSSAIRLTIIALLAAANSSLPVYYAKILMIERIPRNIRTRSLT